MTDEPTQTILLVYPRRGNRYIIGIEDDACVSAVETISLLTEA